MVETITPAGCGGRRRRTLALALFTVGAVGASAGVGALLGLVGRGLDRGGALGVVALLAVLAALREAGLLCLPLPQARRQVPEGWRRRLPLPVWSLGYGAILGAGFLTHQAVTTFWIAAAGCLALGDPVTAGIAMAAFGLGRAVMVVVPGMRGAPAVAVARLTAWRPALGPVNAAGLAVVALLLGTAGAAAATPGGRLDPSASGTTFAFAEIADGIPSVVVGAGAEVARFPGGRSPAVDGPFLAYADDAGIRVVEWRTGAEVARVPGRVDKPALAWPRIAFVRTTSSARELVVGTLPAGPFRVAIRARLTDDLGRPSMRGTRLAFHLTLPRDSRVLLWNTSLRGRPLTVAQSRTGVEANPSVTAGHIAWVEQRAETSRLLLARIGSPRKPRVVATVSGRDRIMWTTALTARRAWFTRWSLAGGRARIDSRPVSAR